jgi:hypothetical protein
MGVACFGAVDHDDRATGARARNATVPYQISTDSGGVTVVLSGNLTFASNLL